MSMKSMIKLAKKFEQKIKKYATELEHAHKAFPDNRPVDLNGSDFIIIVTSYGDLVGVAKNEFVNQVLQAVPLAKKASNIKMDFNNSGLIILVNDDWEPIGGFRDEFVDQILRTIPQSKRKD